MEKEKLSNILLVDKPKGITSFDVIRILRKKLGIRKIGHAGTLDPNATGLMIVAVGEGTKSLARYLKLPKAYRAEILLGVRTDTGDADGVVIETKPVPEFSEEKINTTLKGMIGTIELPVPAYSAVKRQGKPLYVYARKGQNVDIPVKTMRVDEVERIAFDKKAGVVEVDVSVASGTYIRSLAEELGRRLGTVATLRNLRRTRIGEFNVDKAEAITPGK